MSGSPPARTLPIRSGVESPSPSLGPPQSSDSFGRRHWFDRDHNDSSRGEMYIECFLDRMDKFRCSSNDIPLPYPLRVELPSPDVAAQVKKDAPLCRTLTSLCKEYDIEPATFNFYRVSKPGYPRHPITGRTGMQERLTLFIHVDNFEGQYLVNWPLAAKAAVLVLTRFGFADTAVEFLDVSYAYNPICWAIYPENPCVEAYKSFSDRLVDDLIAKLEDDWLSMSLFRLGDDILDPSNSTVELVITVKPYAKYDWHALVTWIKSSVIDNSIVGNTDIGVVIMPGALGELPPKRGSSLHRDFPDWPDLGCGIGISGQEGDGTHGGFFTLLGKQTKRVLLTTSHLTQSSANVDKEIRKDYDVKGIPLEETPDCALDGESMEQFNAQLELRKTNITYPARKDLEATKRHVQQRIGDLTRTNAEVNAAQKLKSEGRFETISDADKAMDESSPVDLQLFEGRIPKLEHRIRMAEAEGLLSEPRLKRLKEKLECEMNELDNMTRIHSKCEDFPKDIAKVVVASGRGLSTQGRILDYALAEVTEWPQALKEHAADDNWCPFKSFKTRNLYNQLGHGDLCERSDVRNASDRSWLLQGPVEKFGRLKLGDVVFKLGRRSKVTAGVCNGVEAYVSMAGWRTPYDKEGRPGPWTHCTYTKEFVVCIAPVLRLQGIWGPDGPFDSDSYCPSDTFCHGGDSGSLILNMNGEAVGLLYGALGPASGHMSFDFDETIRWSDLGIHDGDHQTKGSSPPGWRNGDPARDAFSMYCVPLGLVTPMQDISEHLKTWLGADLSIYEAAIKTD